MGESTRVDGASPYQVIVQQCPTCESKTVGPERSQLNAAESAQIDCDSRMQEPGRRNKASVPPSRRRAVLMRDRHRCQAKGCRSTNFLEVHHLTARKRGGDNSEQNLITLCSRCHQHLHERAMAHCHPRE
ncbi:HNH endonuclease [bacterium]|nr:HNH endonuclease [bacterium]